MKALYYILMSAVKTIGQDIKDTFILGYKTLHQPTELLKIVIVLLIASLIAKEYFYTKIFILLYFLTYIYKIYKQGDWKRKMRNDYYIK